MGNVANCISNKGIKENTFKDEQNFVKKKQNDLISFLKSLDILRPEKNNTDIIKSKKLKPFVINKYKIIQNKTYNLIENILNYEELLELINEIICKIIVSLNSLYINNSFYDVMCQFKIFVNDNSSINCILFQSNYTIVRDILLESLFNLDYLITESFLDKSIKLNYDLSSVFSKCDFNISIEERNSNNSMNDDINNKDEFCIMKFKTNEKKNKVTTNNNNLNKKYFYNKRNDKLYFDKLGQNNKIRSVNFAKMSMGNSKTNLNKFNSKLSLNKIKPNLYNNKNISYDNYIKKNDTKINFNQKEKSFTKLKISTNKYNAVNSNYNNLKIKNTITSKKLYNNKKNINKKYNIKNECNDSKISTIINKEDIDDILLKKLNILSDIDNEIKDEDKSINLNSYINHKDKNNSESLNKNLKRLTLKSNTNIWNKGNFNYDTKIINKKIVNFKSNNNLNDLSEKNSASYKKKSHNSRIKCLSNNASGLSRYKNSYKEYQERQFLNIISHKLTIDLRTLNDDLIKQKSTLNLINPLSNISFNRKIKKIKETDLNKMFSKYLNFYLN